MIQSLFNVKNAGYNTVELWYSDLPKWVGDTVQAVLDDLSLKAYSIHLPKFLGSFEEKQFEDTLHSTFTFIKALGIKVAVLHLPDREQLSSERWAMRYEMLLNEAENANCMLSLENVPYIKDVELYILDEVHKNSDRLLGITVDMEFMHLNGIDIKWLTNAFGERLVNIHFRDSDGNLIGEDGRRHYLIPGEGVIDLQNVVRILHNSGYKGPLTVEVSHRQRENIIKAKEYADNCLKNL